MVKVINNRNRLYNWVRKWGVLDIKKEEIEDYKRAGFSVLEKVFKKKNIAVQENQKTGRECKQTLDHAWVEYDKRLRVADLNKLVRELESKKEETKDNSKDNKENFWKLLVKNGILEESELEWKNKADLKQLAIDNWLI